MVGRARNHAASFVLSFLSPTDFKSCRFLFRWISASETLLVFLCLKPTAANGFRHCLENGFVPLLITSLGAKVVKLPAARDDDTVWRNLALYYAGESKSKRAWKSVDVTYWELL